MSSPSPLIVFDLETGGLDRDRHPIIQFSGAAVDREWSIAEEVEIKIQFDRSTAEDEALELNSYDAEAWDREAVSEDDAMDQISAFFRRHSTFEKVSKRGNPYRIARLCGHNASRFDGEFLAAWFKRAGVFCPAGCFEPLDTVQLARWVFYLRNGPQPENLKLETIAEFLGIPFEGAHDAMADVRVTVEVARQLSRVVARR